MDAQPTLYTDRLTLRPFMAEDAAALQRLANDFAIADTTLNIPHPYPLESARDWIAGRPPLFEADRQITLAITRREDGELLGAIGLDLNPRHARGELGYWIGAAHWNRGYATEAARALLQHGFTTRQLHRIHSSHLTRNPASGRVLQKLGMRHEGRMRQHVNKWDRFEDVELYGLLAAEWNEE